MVTRDRLVPVIVASPLFLQNLDTSVMGTALPSIAQSLHVEALHLNLAITSYLLSLAVFLPVSGWFAERFGARRIFCCAIFFFSIGSALCAAAQTLPQLVLFRILQGLGGAMMVPVGRLILLRSIPPAQIVSAMVWFTVPPAIGRMAGPLFGGAIVTWSSWRWIFLVNVPFGLLAIAMALSFVEDSPASAVREPFDTGGFALLALGLSGLIGAFEVTGKGLVSAWVIWAAAGIGATAMACYGLRRRSMANSIIDLGILRHHTYRVNIIGGMPLRIAIGASPFLLPLMLQLGFGLSPLASGLMTIATAVGSLATRVVMTRVIRGLGFRTLLLGSTLLTSAFYMSYGLFRPETPHLLMFLTLMGGGLVNSMGMVALQTLGFTEIPKTRMSHATTLSSVAQQLSQSFGVTAAASLVSAAVWWYGGDTSVLMARDFSPAFVAIGCMTLLSLFSFVRLDRKDGAGLG